MNSDLRNRILVTLALLILSRFLYYVPVPGVDFSEVVRSFEFGLAGRAHPIAGVAGIFTYLSASSLVVLVIYLRKSLRMADDRRLPVEFYTLVLTAVFALLQGYGRAIAYEQLSGAGGHPLVPDPGWMFRILVMLFTAAGAFLFVWVARMITQHGVGNGVCLLVLVEVLVYLPGYLWGIGKEILDKGHTAPGYAAGYLVIAVAVFLTIVWLVHARWQVPVQDSENTPRRPLSLHVNSVGIAGYYLAISLIGIMASMAMMMRGALGQKIARLSDVGGWGYWIVVVFVTFFATYWLAAVAYDPQGLKRAWDRCMTGKDSSMAIDQKRFDKNLVLATTLLTTFVLAICILLSWHAAKHFLKGLAAVSLFPMTAILTDTYRQYRQRARLGVVGETGDRASTCSDCGSKVHGEAAYCDHCGATFEESGLTCAEHGEKEAEATCVVCGKALCEECAFLVKGRHTCDDHSIVELLHEWATVATVRTQVEADLCKRRLDGIPAEVLSNTVEPMYGTFGLFDVNPITPLLVYREVGGGQIRILVPVRDWIRARQALEMPVEML
jgi:preprotein translocase subunit SecY